MITIQIKGDKKLVQMWDAAVQKITGKLPEIRRQQAIALRDAVRALAPRETGAYAESITANDDGSVTTDAPQANRLEYGFVGLDSLGRHYDQAPQPHWGPAIAACEVAYPAAVFQTVNGAFSDSNP